MEATAVQLLFLLFIEIQDDIGDQYKLEHLVNDNHTICPSKILLFSVFHVHLDAFKGEP